MNSAIMAYDGENVHILATGAHELMESQLEIYKRLAIGKRVLLIDLTGYNIDSIIFDQSKINEEFANRFNT